MFGLVDWAARKGLSDSAALAAPEAAKVRARRTGVRGETYAYWYLRRHGYVMIARNFTFLGMKGEIYLVGYDGATVAFVEVKTRTGAGDQFSTPEVAVTREKHRHLSGIELQFLLDFSAASDPFRFD